MRLPRSGATILLATVIGVAATARLGAWQLSRAAQKQALQAQLDERSALPPLGARDLAFDAGAAEAQHDRRVRLRGHWVARRTVFLDNRQMDGRTGFFVVTPLQLDDAPGAVLVQRGWVPRDLRDRSLLPPVATPEGAVEVEGAIAPPPGRLYEFAPSASGVIRQNLPLGDFARETGLALRPLSVAQADSPTAAGDGLLRRWAAPAVNVQRHYGYAFQWFALAALMTGLYVWFQLIRPRLRRAP